MAVAVMMVKLFVYLLACFFSFLQVGESLLAQGVVEFFSTNYTTIFTLFGSIAVYLGNQLLSGQSTFTWAINFYLGNQLLPGQSTFI